MYRGIFIQRVFIPLYLFFLFFFVLISNCYAEDTSPVLGEPWDGDGDGLCKEVTQILDGAISYVGPEGTPCPESYWYIVDTWWVENWSVGYDADIAMEVCDTRSIKTLNSEYVECPPECGDLADCGGIEYVIWDNVTTCDYHCSNCNDEYEAFVSSCGGLFSVVDNATCSYSCDCTVDTVQASIDCPLGYRVDYETCNYDCNDCDGAFQDCSVACWSLNGIFKFNCTETDIPGEESTVACQCNDISDPILPPDDSPPDPETIPEDDPVDTDNDSGWLAAIKGNTDQLISQNDDQTGFLQDIANNTEKTVENQSVLNDSLLSIGNKLDNLKIDAPNVDLSILEDNTNIIKDNTAEIKDSLATTQVDVDSFDSSFISSMDTAVDSAVSDMQTSVIEFFNTVETVDSDDAGFFKSLFLSVVPPSSTCQPLDLSFSGHSLVIGCEHSDDIKNILSYLVYIFTIIGIFTLIHRELRPNS